MQDDKTNHTNTARPSRVEAAEEEAQVRESGRRESKYPFYDGTVYRLHVMHESIAHVLSPRNTLSNRLSPTLGNLCFQIERGPTGAAVNLGGGVAIVFSAVPLIGYLDPNLAYIALLGLPSLILQLSMLNLGGVLMLLKSADFWGLVACVTVWVATTSVGLRAEPARICSVLVIALSILVLLLFDARLSTKKHANGYILFSVAALTGWVYVAVFSAGRLLRLKHTVLQINPETSFDIQSIGLSFLITVCVVLSKLAWTYFWSDGLSRVVLSCPVSYRAENYTTALSSKAQRRMDRRREGEIETVLKEPDRSRIFVL
jgi:hypothetical protein